MTIFSPEMAAKVCKLLAQGESLSTIEKIDGMPTRQTIWQWLYKNDAFEKEYEKALRYGSDSLVLKMDEAFDDLQHASPQDMPRLKLYLEHLRWKAGKYNARRFGDKTILAGDKDNPLTLNLAAMLDERIAARTTPQTIEHAPPASISLPVLDGEIVESDD